MSDIIKHECGVAMVRLRKPLSYYQKKYGSVLFGLHKMYLLMEKQHNRGQDGAGLACVKLNTSPGQKAIFRKRDESAQAIKVIFDSIFKKNKKLISENELNANEVQWLKSNLPFAAELYLGHLRYGTFGKNSVQNCHPFVRENSWITRNLVMAGNFNLTNVDEQIQLLIDIGQHPTENVDTVTVMEKIGHFLDSEVEHCFRKFKAQGYDNKTITDLIADNLDISWILRKAARDFDGGYHMVGMLGHGDVFALRDPNGIRPAYYYADDEVVVVASERPPIQTAFNTKFDDIKEIPAGNALIVKRNGEFSLQEILPAQKKTSCSFERIYFSRGNDRNIYLERKNLGYFLTEQILESINYDIKNTVFSYIPNTAQVAFYGLVRGVNEYTDTLKRDKILKLGNQLNKENLDEIINLQPRYEKIAIKDAKMRTFITEDKSRNDLVGHVYDVTYGIIRDNIDNLVLLDDSIVRGTTLRESIIKIMDRLNPKKIIIVSSAPQIRYPDCYGIDMSKMGDFVAFNALINLIKRKGDEHVLFDTYERCKAANKLPKNLVTNQVKDLFKMYSIDELNNEIAKIVTPKDTKAEVKIIYQKIENLHKACPNHIGDWYFSGNYPTFGGNIVVNKAFINYYEGKLGRAY
jgi:amidophosphoribosyltransferase